MNSYTGLLLATLAILTFMPGCSDGENEESTSSEVTTTESTTTEGTTTESGLSNESADFTRRGVYRPSTAIFDESGQPVDVAILNYQVDSESGNQLDANIDTTNLTLPNPAITFTIDSQNRTRQFEFGGSLQGSYLFDGTRYPLTGQFNTSFRENFNDVDSSQQMGELSPTDNKASTLELSIQISVIDLEFGETRTDGKSIIEFASPIVDPLAVNDLDMRIGETITVQNPGATQSGQFTVTDEYENTTTTTPINQKLAGNTETYVIQEKLTSLDVNGTVYTDIVVVEHFHKVINPQTNKLEDRQERLYLSRGIGLVRAETYLDFYGLKFNISLISKNFD